MSAQYSSDILSEDMTQTIKQAVRRALLQHRAVGNKIAFWDDGKIVVEVPKDAQLQIQSKSKNIYKSK